MAVGVVVGVRVAVGVGLGFGLGCGLWRTAEGSACSEGEKGLLPRPVRSGSTAPPFFSPFFSAALLFFSPFSPDFLSVRTGSVCPIGLGLGEGQG